MLSAFSRQQALMAAGMLAILLLTAAIYWSGLSGPFMLDDGSNIAAGFIDSSEWDAILYTITHNGSGMLGRGVSMATFVLTGLQYGLDPWGYKYHNLLLHLLNGLMLFRFLQLALPLMDRKLDESKALLVAGTVTAAWLLHPLLVSTVLYAVQRMAQLSTLFTLLSLLAWLKARTEVDRPFRFYFFGWCVMPAMALLALLSKENGALLPLYFLVLEACAFRSRLAELRQRPRLAVWLFVFVLLPLLLAATFLLLKFNSFVDYSGRTFTLPERLLTQLHVVAFYVRQILVPRLRDMSLFLDDFPVTSSLDAITFLLLALFIAVLWLIWRLRNTWPVVAFGLGWFLISHALESTFMPLELVFEHRNYLAAAGLLLLPVYALFRFDAVTKLRVLVPVFLVMFAFMTAARAAEWGNRELFNRMAVEEHPRSGRALTTYVNFLTNIGAYDQSIEYLEKLAAVTPLDAGASLHMQVAKCAVGERDEAALAHARDLMDEYPLSVYAYNGLQSLVGYVINGECPGLTLEDVEPMVHTALAFSETLKRRESYANLVRLRGLVSLQRGRYVSGYSDFRTAHELTGDILLLVELLGFQLNAGKFGDAEDTIALMEQQNARRFGIEQYQVERARGMLERAKQGAARRAEQVARQLEDATVAEPPSTSQP